MNFRILVATMVAVFAISACAKNNVDLSSDKQKFSYAVGFQMAQNLKRQGLELDAAAFSQAIDDVLSGVETKVSDEDMKASVQAFQKKKMEERAQLGEKNKADGLKFLAENKKKEGVTELKSGVQYKVIEKGTGKKPKATDTVVVHYRGTLIDGTEFDSSYKRNEPATFAIAGVVKGWQEIIPLMPVGSKWHIAIPSEMAYGARGGGALIGPNSTLIFEINLIEIKEKPATQSKKK